MGSNDSTKSGPETGSSVNARTSVYKTKRRKWLLDTIASILRRKASTVDEALDESRRDDGREEEDQS